MEGGDSLGYTTYNAGAQQSYGQPQQGYGQPQYGQPQQFSQPQQPQMMQPQMMQPQMMQPQMMQQQSQFHNPNTFTPADTGGSQMGSMGGMGGVDQNMGSMGSMGSMGGNMGNMGSMGGGGGGGGGYGGGYGGGSVQSSGDEEDYDTPLLEELGINFEHIYSKTFLVLHPLKDMDDEIINDHDMAGPLCFCLALGATLMLRGKLHFGYIYGISIIGCTLMWILLNLMCPRGIDIYRTISVLGYCLLPMTIFSACNVLVSMQGIIGLVLGSASIAWCTYSASCMFVQILHDDDQKWLIRYPTFLLYSTFALITVF